MISKGETVTDQNIEYVFSLVADGEEEQISNLTDSDCVCVTSKGKPVKAKTLGQKKYLEAIGKELVSGGLLTAASGRSGGYKLSRAPEDYRISEILELMEGTLAPVACLRQNAAPCSRAQGCKTLPMWQEYYEQTRAFFDSKTLSDLIV